MMLSQEIKSKKKSSQRKSSKDKEKKIEITGILIGSVSQITDRRSITPPGDSGTYHDSGATAHVFHDIRVFARDSIKECEPRNVLLADKSTVSAKYLGEVILPFNHFNIRLRQVLFIPGLGYNLFSVERLVNNGITSLFKLECVELKHGYRGALVGYGERD